MTSVGDPNPNPNPNPKGSECFEGSESESDQIVRIRIRIRKDPNTILHTERCANRKSLKKIKKFSSSVQDDAAKLHSVWPGPMLRVSKRGKVW